MARQVASLLVGDHLGQIKKVLLPSGEVSLLADCGEPSSSNPVVSIEQIKPINRYLIARQNGNLYIYDPIHNQVKQRETNVRESLIKALPTEKLDDEVIFLYEKEVYFQKKGYSLKQKKGLIKNGLIHDNKLALVGKDIPLRVFDVATRNKIFEADPPDKNWLGIRPDIFTNGVDFLAQNRVATCSKSDSVIRIYDTQGKLSKPVISVDLGQTAFNEHADAGRFISVASTGADVGHSLVVGSNVGQIVAIDLRFNAKQLPKKKRLQPKTYKVLGSFKGARGASVRDLKIVPASDEDSRESGHKVISCCLDRYLRVHNFTRNSRQLDKEVYMKTKPHCCCPIFYEDP